MPSKGNMLAGLVLAAGMVLGVSMADASQDSGPTQRSAERMVRTADTVLEPVYAPLAEFIVATYELAERTGVGIDVGGGSGNLVVELSRRTRRMDWINADYNRHFRIPFLRRTRAAGVASRTRFLEADVHDLPLPAGCADVVVSRGSFPFWDNLERGLSEIYRVLKPGGVALVGRGFSPNLPVAVARHVRAQQARRGGPPEYDVEETAAELARAMVALGVQKYRVLKPSPPDSQGVNYGVWLEFRRPARRGGGSGPVPRYTMEPVQVLGRPWRDVVSASQTGSPGLETASTTVDQEDIDRQQAVSVVDALEYVPGAWVESRGRKVKQFVSIRGQRYPYPDYAIAGIWQREFHELPYFLAARDVARLQVMRSSAALLSGLSGLTGVVDIQPRRYETTETAASVEYGTWDSRRVYLSHGSAGADWSYALTAQHRHTDGPEDRHAAEDMLYLRGSGYWQPLPRLDVQTHLLHVDGRRELAQALAPAASRLREALQTFDPFRATLFATSATWLPGPRSSARLQLSWADRRHIFVDESATPATRTAEEDWEWTLNAMYAREMTASNVLRVGGLYNRWVSPTGKRFYAGRRSDMETWSAVAVDEQRWGPLVVDGGVRWSKTWIDEYAAFGIDGSGKGLGDVQPIRDQWEPAEWNAVAGAGYYLPFPVSLHANLAAGYVRPREGSLGTDMTEPDDERRVQVDVGLTAARSGWGQMNVTAYWATRQDAITLSGQTVELDGRILELHANEDRDQAGLELEARSVPLGYAGTLFANLAIMRSRVCDDGRMRRDRRLPRYIGGAGLRTTRSGVDLNLFARYLSGYESTRFVSAPAGQRPVPAKLGDCVTLELTGGYTLKRYGMRLFWKVENLTDTEYQTVPGYPDYGRGLRVGLRWEHR